MFESTPSRKPVIVAAETVLSDEIKLEGRLQSTSNIRFNGEMTGDISTEGDLAIGEHGRVRDPSHWQGLRGHHHRLVDHRRGGDPSGDGPRRQKPGDCISRRVQSGRSITCAVNHSVLPANVGRVCRSAGATIVPAAAILHVVSEDVPAARPKKTAVRPLFRGFSLSAAELIEDHL